METFLVGDVVRLKLNAERPRELVIRSPFPASLMLCVSECGARVVWASDKDLVLVRRPVPVSFDPDTVKAIAKKAIAKAVADGLVGVWFPPASAEAPESPNSLKTLDSSNPLESPDSSVETAANPDDKQPPSGYRLLGDAKDELRIEDDQYWSLSADNWRPLLRHQVFYANNDNWPACRKIETEPEKTWTPKVGERVVLKATGAIYRIKSYDKNSKQYSMEGWSGSCVNLRSIAPCLENELPTEQYREPTLADLANGPIECEVRQGMLQLWETTTLIYVFSENLQPFITAFNGSIRLSPLCRIREK